MCECGSVQRAEKFPQFSDFPVPFRRVEDEKWFQGGVSSTMEPEKFGVSHAVHPENRPP